MYVRLRTEWNSYWKDSVLELSDNEASDLIRERVAILAKKDDGMKEIGRAPRDKMLWGPVKDKAQQAPKHKKKRNERSKRPEGRIE